MRIKHLLVSLLISLPAAAQAPAKFLAHVETTKGTFVLEINRGWSPHGADRFYELAKSGYYDDSRFTRVVPPWHLLTMAHPTDRSDLERLGTDVWAVCFQFPDGKGGYKGRETLFVRLRTTGGQAMVVGFSRVFSHVDYNERDLE